VIGRVLDKYEILEEVGQGGMAVVYRGRDTSLHRDVAVKVLHPHLASHDDARRRFEREAHAVAKLRHENILEIFDYSGRDSPESFIVTEFIVGHTLKEFVTRHKLKYPEVGALIVSEVCRALEHAHGLGVLHRDIKPENIMIRQDGRVKLTDFGIAQIVDAARMTVTGQLLGSPAYMAPEHIDGKPLDFRTDVFSVGILLYQLSTGELPFKGRNPHEILKRIADCKYIDVRVVNPLVGDGLSKVIQRALQREPQDRYPTISLLLAELCLYLDEGELGEARTELGLFFKDPKGYEEELTKRLLLALTRRGRKEYAAGHVAVALGLYNRVLTIDPANDEVLREIDTLAKKKRLLRGAALFLGIVLLASVVSALSWVQGTRLAAAPDAGLWATAIATRESSHASLEVTDAATPVRRALVDAAALVVPQKTPPADAGHERVVTPRLRPDAALAREARTFKLVPVPKSATYSLDGGAFEPVSGGGVNLEIPGGAHVLVFRHPLCEDATWTIAATDDGARINPRLRFKPTRVVPRCSAARAITVNDAPVGSGAPIDITSFGENGKATVRVDFLVGDTTQTEEVTVTAGQAPREVPCAAP
jgi:serine/threonine-protein kinase